MKIILSAIIVSIFFIGCGAVSLPTPIQNSQIIVNGNCN